LRGVYQTELLDMRMGLLEISEGRMFTGEELSTNDFSHSVALISRELADLNNVEIGMVITFKILLFNVDHNLSPLETIFFRETFTLEIVGIFDTHLSDDVMQVESILNLPPDASREIELNHRKNLIHVPYSVANHIQQTWLSQEIARLIDFGEEYDSPLINSTREESTRFRYDSLVFVLKDPMMIEDFEIAIQPHLPENWKVVNLSSAYYEISVAMENIRWLAGNVLLVSIVASILILTLLILILINDRKQEIGIYLALGEKRSVITLQILSEIWLIGLVAISLSLVVGNILATEISHMLIYNDTSSLVDARSLNLNSLNWEFLPSSLHHVHSLQWFSTGRMEVDEMMAFYDVSLDGVVITQFYLISVGIILVVTALPVLYITRLNPKKILMESSSGKSGA